MNAKSLIMATIGFGVLLSIVKIFFVYFFDVTTWYMTALFMVATALVTTGIVRRAGILNNFEVIIAGIFWIGLIMLWDFAILTALLGYDMYRELYWWLGYAAMAAAIVVFHKWASQDKG